MTTLLAPLFLAACASLDTLDPQSSRTLADIRTFAAGIESYAATRQEFPRAQSMEDLRPLLEPGFMRIDSTEDGWGHALRYSSSDGCHYTIASDGPDGLTGTADDILYADNSFVRVPRGAEELYSKHENRRFSCAP